jgi:hypothetical protein
MVRRKGREGIGGRGEGARRERKQEGMRGKRTGK